MSKPMTATELTRQLSEWKLTFKAYKADWATHNRGDRGEGWGDVHGVVIHHTGTDGDARQDLYAGDANLPGPKVQFYIDKLGTIWLIGWGRANHAGGGDPAVLQHVIAENYTGVLTTHFGEGDGGAKDGNAYFYGIEVGYSGSHEMSPAQYSSLMKLCGAIADFHNWGERSFIAHYEWNKYKWDPGCGPKEKRYNMAAVRADIKHAIDAGPNARPTPPPPVVNPPVAKPPVTPPVAKPPVANPVTLASIDAKLDRIIKKIGA